MWSLLVGALLPPLVAFVEQPKWPNWFRAVVGVVASVVAGFVTTYLTADGVLWEQGMLHAMLLTGVAAWASYQSFWKPTNVAPAIEEKTAV
jgi:ABC-type uncharacterized transport system permease subunit